MRLTCLLALFLCLGGGETRLSHGKNKTLASMRKRKLDWYELSFLRLMVSQESSILFTVVRNVHELMDDVNRIKQSLATNGRKEAELQRIILSLQQENSQLKKENAYAKMADFEKKLQTVNENVSALFELETLVAGLQKTVEVLQKENDKLKNGRTNSDARTTELEQRLQEVTENVSKVLEHETSISGLQETTELMRIQMNVMRKENRELRNKNIESEAKVVELEKSLQRVDQNIGSLHSQVKTVQREARDIEDDCSNKTTKVLQDVEILSADLTASREHAAKVEKKLRSDIERYSNSSLENLKATKEECSKLELQVTEKLNETVAILESKMQNLEPLPPTSTVSPKDQGQGIRGTNFLLLFMENHSIAKGTLTSYITTKTEASLFISSSPNLKYALKSRVDQNLNFTSHANISFPLDLACRGSKAEHKAILFSTSELSTVTLFDAYYKHTTDGTTVIPTNKLSTEYIVATTKPHGTAKYNNQSYYNSQFAIGVVYDKTKINIQLKIKNNRSIIINGKAYTSGDIFTMTLGKLETFQVNHHSDLTGTYITATKPIAVFSGNICQRLKRGFCSHMVSQLPPVNELDKEHIVPPFYNTGGTLLKVLSPKQTAFNIRIGKSSSTYQLKAHEHKKFEVAKNKITVVKSDHPVLVTGFAMGSSSNDPYMTVIPGVHQYLDYYKIVVPDNYESNYLCIIISQKSSGNLRINNLGISRLNKVSQQSATAAGKTFSVSTFSVKHGVYVLETTDHEPFGLIVHGHRHTDGYAFAGNFIFP